MPYVSLVVFLPAALPSIIISPPFEIRGTKH
jgi:hypothetical protein